MKHWIDYLPEAGRPLKQISQNINCKREEIQLLQLKMKGLQKEINEWENELIELTKEDWEEVEIQRAKHEAEVYRQLEAKSNYQA